MRQEGQVGCDSGHICDHYLKRQDIKRTQAEEAEETQAGKKMGQRKQLKWEDRKIPESTAAVEHPSPQALPST